MTPPNPPPIPQPARATCPNCGAPLSESAPYCPRCGAPLTGGVARKTGMPVWVKVLLGCFAVVGLVAFCALGACIYLLTKS